MKRGKTRITKKRVQSIQDNLDLSDQELAEDTGLPPSTVNTIKLAAVKTNLQPHGQMGGQGWLSGRATHWISYLTESWLTTQEAADVLNRDCDTITKYCRRGKLACRKVGKAEVWAVRKESAVDINLQSNSQTSGVAWQAWRAAHWIRQTEDWTTLQEVSKTLGKAKSTVLKYCHGGKLEGRKVGKAEVWAIKEESVKELKGI